MAKPKGAKINKMSKCQLAYIAGILDGEGCIAISKKKCRDGTAKGIQYRLYVSVANTDLKMIKFIKQTTGVGSIYKIKRNCERHKTAWRWNLWSIQASDLLRDVHSYLITKKNQAKIGIKFIDDKRDGVGRNGLYKYEWDKQINAHKKMSTLNRRGSH